MNAPLLAAFAFVWFGGLVVGLALGFRRGLARGATLAIGEHCRTLKRITRELNASTERGRKHLADLDAKVGTIRRSGGA